MARKAKIRAAGVAEKRYTRVMAWPAWLKRTLPVGAVLGVLLVGSDASLRAQQSDSSPSARRAHHMRLLWRGGGSPNWSPVLRSPRTSRAQGIAATFLVANFYFDADGNPATQDTVHILAGQTVAWSWESGQHTTTSSDGIWDSPMDQFNPDFSFTFPNVGLYTFYCAVHPGMMGAVEVRSSSGVEPGSGSGLGFTADPYPNPTRVGVDYRFSTRQRGLARVSVYDASGRRVAMLIDGILGPGTHSGAWNGRGKDGHAVASGIYYLRIDVPGAKQTRRITIMR